MEEDIEEVVVDFRLLEEAEPGEGEIVNVNPVNPTQMSATQKEEMLIGKVRATASLWNPNDRNYKNMKEKEDVWAVIARECAFNDGDEAKLIWKRLRDGYRNAKKRERALPSGSARKKFKKWKYMDLMSFLDDILFDDSSVTDSNISAPTAKTPRPPTQPQPGPSTQTPIIINSDDDEDSLEEEDTEEEDKENTTPVSTSTHSRKLTAAKMDEEITNFMKEYRTKRRQSTSKSTAVSETEDDLKMFFLSSYASTKKLKLTNQLKVRRLLSEKINDLQDEEYLLSNNFD